MSSPAPGPVLTTSAPSGRPPTGVVLMLHGGRAHGTDPVLRRHASWWRMALLQRHLARPARRAGVAVELLRYAQRGWNAEAAAEPAPVRDARWALDRIAERYGEVPVVVVGHSMGGRAACALAADDRVRGVVALAPWLPAGEPVRVPAGQRLLLAHGLMDRWTSPDASHAWAARARAAGGQVARFELPMVGHFMFASKMAWNGVVRRGALGLLDLEPLPEPVLSAFAMSGAAAAAPVSVRTAEDGLRLPVSALR